MLSTTKWISFAVLATAMWLCLSPLAQAAPLAGVYWSAQQTQADDGSNEANIYYAPFDGSSLGAPELINTFGLVNLQVNAVSVASIGGTNYLFYAGCCGDDGQGIYRSTLTGSTPGTLTMGPGALLTGNPNGGGLAIDTSNGTGYWVDNSGVFHQSTDVTHDASAFAGSTSTVDTNGGSSFGIQKVYFDPNTGKNTIYMTSGNNDDTLLSYTFNPGATAGAVFAGKATIGPIGGDGASGDIGSVAFDPTNGLYFVSSNGGNVEWDNAGSSQVVANGAQEIKEISVDPEHGYVYYSDQNGDPSGSPNANVLERFLLGSTGPSDQQATPFTSGSFIGQPDSVFVVLDEQTSGVPEPSTFVLAAIGLAGLGLVGWRRRRSR